jgi:hypothetical protein
LSGTEVLFCQVQKYYFCNPYFEDFVWFGSGGGGGGDYYYYYYYLPLWYKITSPATGTQFKNEFLNL